MESYYSKAFVGVYSIDNKRDEFRVPSIDSNVHDDTQSLRHQSATIHLIGKRCATQAFQVEGDGFVCVKGRPFSLTQNTEAIRLGPSTTIADQLADLDGRFSLCTCSNGTLTLATDLIGASAIYYHVDGASRLIFSTHLGLLLQWLRDTPVFDDQGVAGILAGSCMVGSRTPYRNVYRLGAGQMLSARQESGEIRHEVTPYLDVAAVLAEPLTVQNDPDKLFEKLLCESLIRETRNRDAGILLSGGKDSQALAQGLLLSGIQRFPAATFGEWRSRDVRGAKRFAAATGLRHSTVSYRAWRFESYAPMIVSLAGGISGFQTAHNIVGYDRARKQIPFGLVGYLGDALTGAHLPRENQRITDKILPFRDRWNPMFAEVYGESLARLEAEIDNLSSSYQGLSVIQRHLITDLVVRQATWISSTFDLCDWLLPVAFPFYSRDLFRFCFNLSAAQLQGQSFYGKWLKLNYPRCVRRKNLFNSWSTYEFTQKLCDRVSWRTGKLKAKPLIDWDDRILAEKTWLRKSISTIQDSKIRDVCKAQAFNEREGVPLLLGVALGTAASAYSD